MRKFEVRFSVFFFLLVVGISLPAVYSYEAEAIYKVGFKAPLTVPVWQHGRAVSEGLQPNLSEQATRY